MGAIALSLGAVFALAALLPTVDVASGQDFPQRADSRSSEGAPIVGASTTDRLSAEQMAADRRLRQPPRPLSPTDFVFPDDSVVAANYEGNNQGVQPAQFSGEIPRNPRPRAYTPPTNISNDPTASAPGSGSNPTLAKPSGPTRSSDYNPPNNTQYIPVNVEDPLDAIGKQPADGTARLRDQVNAAKRDAANAIRNNLGRGTDTINNGTAGAAAGPTGSVGRDDPRYDRDYFRRDSESTNTTGSRRPSGQLDAFPDNRDYRNDPTVSLRNAATRGTSGVPTRISTAGPANSPGQSAPTVKPNSTGNPRKFLAPRSATDPRAGGNPRNVTNLAIDGSNPQTVTTDRNIANRFSSPVSTTNYPGTPQQSRNKDGVFLTLLVLFASVGLNMYLGWVAWDTYNRYQELVSDVRYSNPRGSSRRERDHDRSYGERELADSGAY